MDVHDIGKPQLELVGEALGRAVRAATAANVQPVTLRGGTNPATQLDRAVDERLEVLLLDLLHVPVLSEEHHVPTKGDGTSCWVVDPINGTINAMVGAKSYSVSVALVEQRRRTALAAAVYLSETDVLFEALSGLGARRNGTRLVGTRATSGQNIVAFGIPHNSHGVADRTAEALRYLMSIGWITRQTGAATIDICNVAAGQWRGFFEYGLQYWDFAAAALIATEAGCVVRATPLGSTRDSMPLEYDLVVAKDRQVADTIQAAMASERGESGKAVRR